MGKWKRDIKGRPGAAPHDGKSFMAGRCPTIVVLLQDDLPMVRSASPLLTMSGHLSGRCPSKKTKSEHRNKKERTQIPPTQKKNVNLRTSSIFK